MGVSNNPFDPKSARRFNNNVTSDSFDEIIKDSTSMTTVQTSQKRKTILGWSLLALLIIAILVWGAFQLLKPPPMLVEETVTQSIDVVQSGPSETVEEITLDKNPMKEISKGFPVVAAGEVTATLEGNTISLSGTSLGGLKIGEEFTMRASEVPCTVREVNELCLAAVGQGEGGQQFEVLYLKDAVRGRIFENARNFETIEIKGSPLSASFTLGDSSRPLPMMVTTLQDGGGFLIRYSEESFSEKLSKVMEVIE